MGIPCTLCAVTPAHVTLAISARPCLQSKYAASTPQDKAFARARSGLDALRYHIDLATRFQNAQGSKGFRKRLGEVRVLVVSTEDGLKDTGKSQERVTEAISNWDKSARSQGSSAKSLIRRCLSWVTKRLRHHRLENSVFQNVMMKQRRRRMDACQPHQ